MKRRYEKVIEKCEDCPAYNTNIAYIWCMMRDLSGRWSEGDTDKVKQEWFATCDLPEVNDAQS